MYSPQMQNLIRSQWHMHQDYMQNMIYETNWSACMSIIQWWKEIGAFIWTAPRQIGKTTFLKHLDEKLSSSGANTVFIAHNIYNAHMIQGLNYAHIHLLVDEYNYIPDHRLDSILDHPWKSVTMVGSLI